MENESNEMETKPNGESNSILTPKEYLKSLLSKAKIEVVEDIGIMRAILDEGKRVQKMAAKYGTSQDIGGEENFSGFGTYVVSVNEENARRLGIKIASKRYGGSFHINGQPFSEFLKEKNFSPYWTSRLGQFRDHSAEYLAEDFLRADVKGNPALEKERDTLSTLFSLGLVEYKRERAFLYSVDIPDNDGTNYLLYGNPIGIENADRINGRLERMNVEWRVSRNDIGKNVYFNTLSEKVFGGSQESASKFLKEAGYAGMEMNSANYIVFDDKDMKVTDRVRYMIDGESNVYGFAYDGKVYADPEIATSNTYAHEYTHLWDAYTRRTNPELWKKGKDIFKGTSLWNEVMADENYRNLSDDDEILSECHSRIAGRMAEKVLERIAERNGGILRDQVIDWDNEVAEYVASELGAEFPEPELGSEDYISDSVRLEIAREFLSRPMKDLTEGRRIGIEREKSELYKENEAELKFIVEEMMEETLPGLPKMAKSVENEKDPAASTSTQLSGATSAQDPSDAQDAATAISTHIRHKDNIVEIKNQEHFIETFNAFAREITNSDTPMPPKEFLDKIKKTFDMNVAAETTGYAFTRENDETFKIRISDHKAVLRNRLGARTELTSLVIQLNDSRRRDSDKAKLSEFVYFPESLDKETQVGIINGINDWISRHEYTDKHYDQMYVSTARALQERLEESEQTVSKMAKSVESEISEPTAKEWVKDSEAKLNSDMEQNIHETEALSSEDVEPPPAEENVVAERKTVKASEIFKDFEEGMIFSGISHKDFDSAMLDYLHQRSGMEEAGNGTFDTQAMFELLVAQKINDARARTFALDKIGQYEGMTVEFDAGNIDLGYLRLSDRDGAEEVRKGLEELKAAHPVLVKNLSMQDETEETANVENPFPSADPEQVQELYEQAEAVEKMQQEAASAVEFDENGNPYYPKNEAAEEKMPEMSFGKEAASAPVEPSAEKEVSSVPAGLPAEQEIEIKGADGKIFKTKIEFGKTAIATFAMVTQNGLKSYSDMAVASYEKTTDSYLLVSGDKSRQVRVQSSTMAALLSDGRQKEIEKTNSQIEENQKTGRSTESLEFKKERLEQGMSVAQYNDFFQTRENCANNFRHNLSVMCRREANSPLDALKVANKIITQMSDAEKVKTRDLLDLLRKDGQSRNEVLVDAYNEAVKATPLNEQYLLSQRYDKMIARPMYDTVSDRGERIDGNFNLKVGDTVKMTFNVDKDIAFGGTKLERKRPAFGNKEVMFSECKIISSSKEGNVVTLMDGNKSFYDVPRDTFLKEYAKREKYERKQEIKEAHKKNIMRLDIER